MPTITPKDAVARYRRARERRETWEGHWQQCYDFALPQREGALSPAEPGGKKTDRLFDGTAPDAVDQLAASLLAELTPPWARWFGLSPGRDASKEERDTLAPELDNAATALRSHFDRSNFAIEIHQAYLDLVTVGTACLLFEEAPPGDSSAFRFTAVPLGQVVFEEGLSGRLDTTFRRTELTLAQFRDRFPKVRLPKSVTDRIDQTDDGRVPVIEAVVPDKAGFAYAAVLEGDSNDEESHVMLREGRFAHSPFLNFRWLKAPGEIYGRSPVMKALPDIKTANKVVELILKNATISVTGIWQADDDGVLNLSNLKLTPGTIIPKAVGSKGLTPLEAPGKFAVSQNLLDDMRGRIRHALLVDKLGQVNGPRMTATEVLERSAEMARLLGATYGRLQSELLTPLVTRAVSILSRRGEIPKLGLDGRMVELEYRSPLARQHARQEGQSALTWLQALGQLGPEAASIVNAGEMARFLARTFGVPGELIRQEAVQALDAAMGGTSLGDPAQLQALAGQAMEALGEDGMEEISEQISKAVEAVAGQGAGQ